MSTDYDFEDDHPEYTNGHAAAVAVLDSEPEPAPVAPNPASDETPAQKRVKLMGLGAAYRDSVPHQTAAQTWAIVELVEATEAQTAELSVQNQLLARQIAAAELQARAALMQVQLQIYQADARLFPAGVLSQMKVNANIGGASAAASDTPSPALAVGSEPVESSAPPAVEPFDFS